MSYHSIVQMANSQSLIARIAASAAAEGYADHPLPWAQQNIWRLASSVGWDDAWSYAEDTKTNNQNPDTGERHDVITDAMIQTAVVELLAEQNPVVEEQAPVEENPPPA